MRIQTEQTVYSIQRIVIFGLVSNGRCFFFLLLVFPLVSFSSAIRSRLNGSATRVHHAICINHTIAFTLFKNHAMSSMWLAHTLNRFAKELFHTLFAPNFHTTQRKRPSLDVFRVCYFVFWSRVRSVFSFASIVTWLESLPSCHSNTHTQNRPSDKHDEYEDLKIMKIKMGRRHRMRLIKNACMCQHMTKTLIKV